MDFRLPGVTGCLSDELLVQLSEGRLSDAELGDALRHAAGCGACHDDIASVVHVPGEEGPGREERASRSKLLLEVLLMRLA